MKRIASVQILIAALITVSACSGADQAVKAAPVIAADAKNVEQTITNLEQEWVAAILAKDAATIDRLLADGFVGTTDDQRYYKADAIEDVRTGEHMVLTLDNIQVRVYGDTAIAIMDQEEQSRHAVKDFSGHYLFTNIWVKQNGQWRVVGSHGSRVR
jgi:ketosteroid isomerase-like protein